MKELLLFATLTLLCPQGNYASLILLGPEYPVLEGDYVTLQCLSDTESNMTDVHVEKFSKHLQKWFRVEPYGLFRRCFYYDLDISREPGRLELTIPSIQSFMEGPYRCVSDDAAFPYNSSLPLTVPVHYMRDVSVSRLGVSSYSRYFSPMQDLRVRVGEDVEAEDWLVLSSKLKLKKVRVEDSGSYTCTAQHPAVSSLSKSRTISITVLSEDAPWYDSTQGRLVLMTSAAGVVVLLLIVSVSVCLCRRASAKNSKGPM
ncbi:hypothetical protein JZ751_007422 [Albula glossodonta]|uniref:Ig-like domain-containing protein n=1 Tax=Albula glossodonta TaxID=121402 RepID=A0A8T2N7K2_9TELE|nr:hypothetical protein JZ751_007422 [Albula glossodonta]